VAYNVTATDTCCAVQPNPTITFTPPETTCFPVNSTTTVKATATDQCGNTATTFFTVTVNHGTNCGTNCISISSTNIVAYTCSNCTFVSYKVSATDTCCPGQTSPTLTFNPPETTCFPLNSVTPVQVIATDLCGNSATNVFTVTILPDTGCRTNCISIFPSNIVVYTCSNCTTVPYNVSAFDNCCSSQPTPNLTFNPPPTFCFPLNSVTPVQVVASDVCSNSVIGFFTVTVLPGTNCGGTRPGISITGQGAPGGSGTNYLAVWWNGTNAQVEMSPDLFHWQSVPGPAGSNSPYVFPSMPQSEFFRLHYH
jgi:hypothetical protein